MSAVLRESNAIQWVPMSLINAHPQNPRLVMRDDVIAQIATQLSEHGYQPKHAIHIRPVADRYQVISGHHRLAAAANAGLAEVPAWVEVMDDDSAYMELVLSNAQGELSPLEIGMHALHYVAKGKRGAGNKGDGLKAYADAVGRNVGDLSTYRNAAKVAEKCLNSQNISSLLTKAKHLSAIHALPEECWTVTVEAMLAKGVVPTTPYAAWPATARADSARSSPERRQGSPPRPGRVPGFLCPCWCPCTVIECSASAVRV